VTPWYGKQLFHPEIGFFTVSRLFTAKDSLPELGPLPLQGFDYRLSLGQAFGFDLPFYRLEAV